jgi:tRNA(fMet)-specific endonuclease VapC
MILLDTDHVTALKYQDTERYRRLTARLANVGDELVGVTVITVEEQFRGWLAAVAKERQPQRQVRPYDELIGLFEFFSAFEIVRFDPAAADRYDTFGAIRVSAMDKKIAAIALVNNALLLTANRRDFEQFPGLRIDNWMD